MNQATLKDLATDALRYWEPRRFVYCLVLTAVTIGEYIAIGPAARSNVSLDVALHLFVLAVIANLLYCAAYVADVFVQHSGFQEPWRRHRWILFVIGTCFAAILTHYIAAAIFGRPHF